MAREAAARMRVPSRLGRRGWLLAFVLFAAALAWLQLGLSVRDAVPGDSGRGVLSLFVGGAFAPALTYESDVPEGTAPLLVKVALAVVRTVVFAAAGMSLSLVVGLLLGFLGATSWWADDGECTCNAWWRKVRCYAMPAIYGGVRVVIALMRSVHELLWAVLFLAAFGLNSFSAVVAIAIPYGGTLAKVFSEMLDECPRDSARSLRAIGADSVQVFAWGLLPRAMPDMSAYAFYRFECAIRSSAVLGFFGYPTIGYYLKLSAENLHYREVWTYLYALCALVLLFELWSSQLRRRIVIR